VNLPGLSIHAPLEDPNVFQHTSPERLVRMMVMMVVFKLNAVHKILLNDYAFDAFNLNHFKRRKQGLFIINSFHID
jgi:hypothetical protein